MSIAAGFTSDRAASADSSVASFLWRGGEFPRATPLDRFDRHAKLDAREVLRREFATRELVLTVCNGDARCYIVEIDLGEEGLFEKWLVDDIPDGGSNFCVDCLSPEPAIVVARCLTGRRRVIVDMNYDLVVPAEELTVDVLHRDRFDGPRSDTD